MATQAKKFNSILDTDLSEAEVDFLSHIDGLNITFRGNPGAMRAQNIIGNSLIPNPGLPAPGNQCIGAFYDQVKQRLIYLNCNLNDNEFHGIYIYNTALGTVQTLLMNGSATEGDILGFSINNPVTSTVIIYQEEQYGDILCYIDSLGRPTAFNIDRYLNTPYAITKRAFIDLAKPTSWMRPRCCYENDQNALVNNCLNSGFKFRFRWVYDDYQKIVGSTGSEVPVPTYAYSGLTPSDPTQDCRIRICIPTGDVDVIKIELWVQQITNDVQTGNWFLVNSFDKATLNIPSNDIYQFLFYNDSAYPTLPVEETSQLFDVIPLWAQCMELLNGNSIVMQNIQEGFNQTAINANLTASQTQAPTNVQAGCLFFAAQSGTDSYGNAGDNIEIFLFGAGTNDGAGNPTEIACDNLTFNVSAALANGTNASFSYNGGTTQLISNILGGLQAAAAGAGYTVISRGTNNLIVSLSNVELYYAQAVNNSGTISIDQSTQVYARRCLEDLALIYFDAQERTIGAQLPINAGVSTLEDLTGATIPQISVTINHRPPPYAFSYSLGRAQLTYNKYLEWISDQTFIDIDQDTGNQYAYIGYSNMDVYNEDITTLNPGGTPVVNYSFQQGDRIRFELQYPVGGLPVPMLLKNDYQILSVEGDPVINGIVQQGQFIKILYPTNDITGNFNFGGDNFQNYKILIYSYLKRAINTATQLYSEFGKRWAIGNPGTANAFHIGSDQSQTATLTQPAIVNVSDGEFWYRNRPVPAGVPYYINVLPCVFAGHGNLLTTVATQQDQGLIDNSIYQIAQQQQSGSQPSYNPAGSDQIYWNKQGIPVSVRLKGTLGFYATITGTFDIVFQLYNAGGEITNVYRYITRNFQAVEESGESTYTNYTVPIDTVLTIPANTQAWFSYYFQPGDPGPDFSVNVAGFSLRFQWVNIINIPVTDASMFDSYNVVLNGNGRQFIFDPNARQNTYTTGGRYSLADEFGTNINQMNRFYPQNFFELDRSKGATLRMKTRDRIIRFFQQRGACEMGIYNTFIKNSEGTDIITATDDILTKNNVKVYEGEYGLGNHPEGLISGKIQDYIFDPVRGYLIRLSQDGMIPISEIYKGQYYIRSLITPYVKTWTRANTGPSLLLGCYNYFEEEAIFLLQGGTNGSQTINNYCLGFNERRNAFASPYSFNQAEWIVSAEEDFYTFMNGNLYLHDNSPSNTAPYCNFFGTQYDAYITTVFNENLLEKKTFMSISEMANQIWQVPLIYTNEYTWGTTQQSSYLVPGNFRLKESMYSASFMRDTNSPGGWTNGFRLKGNWIAMQLRVIGASQFVHLDGLILKYIDSPLTAQ